MIVTTGRAWCPLCERECDVVRDEWLHEGMPQRTERFTRCCGAVPVYCEGELSEFVGNPALIRKSNRNRLNAEAFGPEPMEG